LDIDPSSAFLCVLVSSGHEKQKGGKPFVSRNCSNIRVSFGVHQKIPLESTKNCRKQQRNKVSKADSDGVPCRSAGRAGDAIDIQWKRSDRRRLGN